MNKTTINAINNYTKKKEDFSKKYFEYKKQYAITDTYSIVLLNDIPSDYSKAKNQRIIDFIKDFSKLDIVKNINLEDLSKYKSEKINNLYHIEFNVDEVKSVLKILKKSTINILYDKNNNVYILKLENKNGEIAYILPMKVF